MKKNDFFLGEDAIHSILQMNKQLHSMYLNQFKESIEGAVVSEYSPSLSLLGSGIKTDIKVPLQNGIVVNQAKELKKIKIMFSGLNENVLTSTDEDFSAYNCEILIPRDTVEEDKVKSCFDEGINILTASGSFFEQMVGTVLLSMIPLRELNLTPTFRSAFSFHFYKGGSFFALPDFSSPVWRVNFAIDIAHEIGHQVLMIYQMADRILESSLEMQVFSGVRRVPRPAIMSVHAAAALGYMIEYLESILEKNKILSEIELAFASKELVNYKNYLSQGLDALNACTFTPFGNKLIQELSSKV